MFARLLYYGATQLGRIESEVLLMPIGELLDQWETHKQFTGMAKPKRKYFIDDVNTRGNTIVFP